MNPSLHALASRLRRKAARAAAFAILCGGGVLLAACGQLQTAADSTAAAAASETATPAASETGTPLASVTVTPVATPPPTTPGPLQFPGGLFGDGVGGGSAVATTGWVTYKNEEYGFSFQYPANWQIDESEATPEQVGPHGEPAYPRYSVAVQNPKEEQGSKIPGVNCTHEPETCIGANPHLLAFEVSVTRPLGACDFPGALSSDVATLSGVSAERCVSEFPNDKTRGVSFQFPLPDGDVIRVQVGKGNAVDATEQAVLETVLGTFRLAAPLPATAVP